MRREETVDHNIKAVWHAISRMYNQHAGKHGLTMSTGFALLNIDAREGTPATKIAPLMGLESRSLTRMLRNLEQRGLITRDADPVDRRLVRVKLTEKGSKKRNLAKEAVLRFNETIRREIDEDELRVFFSVLSKVNAIVERNEVYETVDS